MTRILISLLLTLVAVSNLHGQAPQSKPNFSGTWIFNAKKSTLMVPAPANMTLRITHDDPKISFARSQVYGDKTFQWDLETLTDGKKEVVQKSRGYTSNNRVYWQGDSLVIEQKLTSEGTTVNDVVTYTLAPDGQSLEAVEHFETVGTRGSATNKWAYQRQGQ